MNRIVKFTLIIFPFLIVLLGALAAWRIYSGLPSNTVQSERLSCSHENFLKYFAVSAEAGEMGLSYFNPQGSEPPARFADLLAYDALGLSGNETVVIVGHMPTSEVFVQTCAKERCTIEEMSAPMTQCLTEKLHSCVYTAIRFQGTDHCLIQPVAGEE